MARNKILIDKSATPKDTQITINDAYSYSMDARLTIAVFLWCALAGVAVIPLFKKGEFTNSQWRTTLCLFLALLAIALPVWRLRSLLYDGEINVDESQLLAQVLRYKIDPIPWRGVDGGSSGPLNTWALLWGPLCGLKADYFVARITGLGCLWTMLAGLTFSLLEIVGRRLALLLVMPAATLLLTSLNFDYVFFSSEQLPIALIAWIVYCIARQSKSPTYSKAYVLGFLTGALPFCKIQVGPAAVYLWTIAAFAAVMGFPTLKRAVPTLIIQLLGGISVPTLILGPVAAVGSWNDFVDLYIKASLAYKSSVSAPSLSTFWQLIGGVPEFYSFSLVCAGTLTIGFLTVDWGSVKYEFKKCVVPAAVLGFALIISYGIYRTGFAFPHYTLLLILPCTFVATLPTLFLPSSSVSATRHQIMGVACSGLVLAILATGAFREMRSHPQLLASWGSGLYPIGEILRKFAGPNDTMFVWGYAPKYHVLSEIAPASRFTQSTIFFGLTREAEADPRGTYARFAADLEKSKPKLFVDAPDEFWFPDSSLPRGVLARHNSVKPVAKFVADNYHLVQQINMTQQKTPILIYLRNSTP